MLAQRLVHQDRPRPSRQTAAFIDPAYQPPLIGREGKRALLLQMLDQVQAGRGEIALPEGAAGVGKSRLLDTLSADARWWVCS
jgi:hypothetical protein